MSSPDAQQIIQLTPDLFPKPNLGVVLYGKNDLRLETVPLPDKLYPDEVLLKSHSIGICGSDIHLWKHAQLANFQVHRPYCLGHEPSATVMKVGKNVTHLVPGDRVVIEPAIPCLRCEVCRQGRYNLCPTSNLRSRGLPHYDGTLRRYYVHRADFTFKLPNNVSMEEGALVEALSVVVHSCRRVGIHPHETVLVCGAGTVGILCMLTAKAMGCDRVCITDINQSRLDMAKKLGADLTYLIDVKEKDDNKLAKEIAKIIGKEPDVTMECSGVESSQTIAIFATKYGGRVALVGLGSPYSRVPLATAAMKEIDLYGICRMKDDYPFAIRLLETGRVNIKSLITHRFPVQNSLDAFNLLCGKNEGVLKVLIQYDQ